MKGRGWHERTLSTLLSQHVPTEFLPDVCLFVLVLRDRQAVLEVTVLPSPPKCQDDRLIPLT